MRRFVLFVIPVLAFLTASATAQTQTAAQPTYDVSFSVADQVYTGTTTFVVDAKGVVTGTMKLTVPVEVNATLRGAVKDGVWTFEYPYQIPAQMCDGTVSGTAKVDSGRKSIAGDVTIGGSCTEQPMTSTFTFTRREK